MSTINLLLTRAIVLKLSVRRMCLGTRRIVRDGCLILMRFTAFSTSCELFYELYRACIDTNDIYGYQHSATVTPLAALAIPLTPV